jgi:hypothetical protein
MTMMTGRTLADFGPSKVFLVSVGIPAGVEIDLEDTEAPDAGAMVPLDPGDAANALPFDPSEVEGEVDDEGVWRWDGAGDLRDWSQNPITQLVAWKD